MFVNVVSVIHKNQVGTSWPQPTTWERMVGLVEDVLKNLHQSADLWFLSTFTSIKIDETSSSCNALKTLIKKYKTVLMPKHLNIHIKDYFHFPPCGGNISGDPMV